MSLKLKITSLLKFSLLILSLTLFLLPLYAQIQEDRSKASSKIKVPDLRPGTVIFIGEISPELEELLFLSKENEITREMEIPLTEEERAQLEKRLEELKREKNILSGDFYGINQYGYRYALIFDRLGYIRYRLAKIDEEIAAIQKKISK